MIILAHDGSLYCDWVALYALRFAATDPDRTLLLLHVIDGRVEFPLVESRVARLADLCADTSVDFHREFLPLEHSAHRTLRQATPHDPEALLVCGTRVKPRRQALLAGSVAELLLRSHLCPVLALRVVQPGLLGLPHDLLLPLAGHPAGFARLAPILRRLAPQLRRLYFLHILPANPLTPHRSVARQEQLRQNGHHYLDQVGTELAEELGSPTFIIDRRVQTSTDPAHQILIEASRLKAQMLLLGASERSLAHRVLHGQALEQILLETPCDVGIYRAP